MPGNAIDWWTEHYCLQDFGVTYQYANEKQRTLSRVKAVASWERRAKASYLRAKDLPED